MPTLVSTPHTIAVRADDGRVVAAIDRTTMSPVVSPSLTNARAVEFLNALGLYKEDDSRYIAVIQRASAVPGVPDVYKVTKIDIIQLTALPESRRFVSLLRQGLNQCSMYFSPSRDLSLSRQRRLAGSEPRSDFVWNWVPMAKLRETWPEFGPVTSVIAGFVGFSDPFCLISRRSRLNAGIHAWNRGADENGNAANFVETEETATIGDRVVSFVQLRGSCPVFWTQFPVGIPSPSIRLGSREEGLRRFELHFDSLEKAYGSKILVVSLTSPGRREGAMTEMFQDFTRARKLEFRWVPFVSHMDTPGGIESKVAELAESLEWLEVDGRIIVTSQTAFVRTNCMSSLDRTGVFQFFLSGEVMKKFATLTHGRAELWRSQANELAMAYAGAAGQKLVIPFAGRQTTWGEVCDYANRGRRFVNSLLFEGRMDDAYAAVCQERRIFKTKQRNVLMWFLLFLTFLLGSLLTLVFKGKGPAERKWRAGIKEIISHPRYRDIRNADSIGDRTGK
jgi:hypothetical protein